jgi:hypothetical protein
MFFTTPSRLILRQILEDRRLHAVAFFFEHAARGDDVPAALVELDDPYLDHLVQQGVHVLHLTQRDLGAGQERLDPVEVDHHAALDLPHQLALDHLRLVVGVLDAVPNAHEVRALLGQDDQAVLVFHLLQEDLDGVAYLDRGRIGEFRERDDAFALESHVDQHVLVVDMEHRAAHDLPFAKGAHRIFVLREQLGARFCSEFVLVVVVDVQQS